MKKAIIYSLVTIGALALIFWKLESNKKKNQATIDLVKQANSGAIPVNVERAVKIVMNETAQANGNFAALHEVTLVSEVAGRVTEILVKEGSIVKAGQVVARIDNEVADAQSQSALSALKQARTDLERFEKAFESGGVTKKQLDDIRLQHANAEAQYTAVRRSLENTYVKAPISGTINARYIERGAYLSPGSKMFDIVDVSKLKLVVSVPEYQVVNLKAGQEVTVKANVFPEVEYRGKISFIAAKGDKALSYPVEVEVENIEGKSLKAGMYGTAIFGAATDEAVIMVPRSAFYNGVNSGSLFVHENGKAVLRQVIAGSVVGDRVQIRKGLEEGDQVIVSGQVNLIDGSEVTIQNQ